MARPILLAVDDDVHVLEAVVQDLRRQYGNEYRVMRAASGQAALDTLTQIKAKEEPVALIVSDQRMPGMTGVELARAVRASRPRTNVLIISGYAEVEGLAPELPRLAKPFRQNDLAESLARLEAA